MTKSKFFLLLSCIFLAACLFGLIFLADYKIAKVYFYLASLGFFILAFYWRYFLVIVVILLALIRVNSFAQAEFYNQAHFSYEQSYSFTGQIVDLDQKINTWQLVIQPLDLPNFKGKVLVYVPLYPEYRLRDRLVLQGKIFRPEVFKNEITNRTFAYDKFLAKDQILATMSKPQIKVISSEHNTWQKLLANGKQYFLNNLNNYVPEPASSFAKAITLDARRELPKEINPSFSYTGLSHVISISGLHMVVIILFWQAGLQFLGLKRQYIFWVLVLSLLAYLYLLNFISPALRSTAMMLLVLLGPMIGRPAISAYSLLCLADILVLLNPYILLYDLGFQLSFLATLGLIWYTAWWQIRLVKLTNRFKLREVLAVTLAAQTFTWPLVLYYFGIFSIVAPLANFLVLPLFPPILILALLIAILGGPIANFLSYPLLILVKAMFYLVDFLANLPGAYMMITDFSLAFLIISLSLLFGFTIIIKPYVKKTI